MNKRITVLSIVIVLILSVSVLYKYLNSSSFVDENTNVQTSGAENKKKDDTVIVKIGHTVVKVDIANTPLERMRGLSGREFLKEGEGMFFVYDKSGIYTFWMPDMNFALDIIWISGEGRVVYIKENATPENYPEKYTPSEYAKYVLEVPSGYAKRKNIKIGSKVEIVKK